MHNHHFAPASPQEKTAFGARRPDPSVAGIQEWIAFMKQNGIQRVCCLLSPDQMADYPRDLIAEYQRSFGADHVLHAPIADFQLCSPFRLENEILPFLRSADTFGSKAVVHCWSGNGRTGHILAAWLCRARGLQAEEAIETVQKSGRKPREAVDHHNATETELVGLLTGSA